MSGTEGVSWEAVSKAITQGADVPDDEVVALATEFLARVVPPTDQMATTSAISPVRCGGRRVDTVGCANTAMWGELAHQEGRYVQLSAKHDLLRPHVEEMQARWDWIQKRTFNLNEWSTGDDLMGALMLVLAVLIGIVCFPVRPCVAVRRHACVQSTLYCLLLVAVFRILIPAAPAYLPTYPAI